MNYYQQQIQKVTNAPSEIVPILENIMREDIFHSTLDWQTPRQFNHAARQAYAIYQANVGFFQLQTEMRAASFAQHKAESQNKVLTEQGAPESDITAAKLKLDTANRNYSKLLEKLNQSVC